MARPDGESLLRGENSLEFDDYSMAGILTVNDRGVVLDANLRAAFLLGLPRRELLETTLGRFFADQEREAGQAMLQRLFRSLTPQRMETRLVKPDGSDFFACIEGAPLPGGESSQPLARFTITDITERRAFERHLLRIKFAVDSAGDAMALARADGVNFYINPAFSRLMDYADAESLNEAGGPAAVIADPVTAREVAEALEQGQTWSGETVLLSRSGRAIPVLLRADVARDETGHVVGHTVVATDITERKKSEEEMALAMRAAEQASRAKGDFLANMSHEIRTPITGIMGMTELLLHRQLEPESRKYIEIIRNQARVLQDIVNDILDFSKIEAGKTELKPEHFDPRRMVQELADAFAVDAGRKKLGLSVRVAPGVPEALFGDAGKISQILRNLISNAIKFTASGAVEVEALPEAGGQAQGLRMRFTVRDTGQGIPRDKLGMLFKSFTQLDSSYSKRFSGTGLGLAICRNLTDVLGGEIWVESEPGRGSAFHVAVPLSPGRQQPEAGAAPDQPPFRPMRLLLAEDNEVNQLYLATLLEEAGCIVTLASNGREALNALSGQEFDAVIMDIQMPVMDGVEATGRIRRGECGEAKRHIPVVALTAYAMKGDRERFLEAGLDEYVAKPVQEKDLQAALSRAVAGRRGPASDVCA